VRTIHWPEVIASAWPLRIIPADHQAFLLTARNRPLDSDKARIAGAMRGSRTSQTVGTAGHNRVICSLPGAGRAWRGPPSVDAKLDDLDEYEQHGGDRVTAQGDDPGIERG
jgi:hypothetical protein